MDEYVEIEVRVHFSKGGPLRERTPEDEEVRRITQNKQRRIYELESKLEDTGSLSAVEVYELTELKSDLEGC